LKLGRLLVSILYEVKDYFELAERERKHVGLMFQSSTRLKIISSESSGGYSSLAFVSILYEVKDYFERRSLHNSRTSLCVSILYEVKDYFELIPPTLPTDPTLVSILYEVKDYFECSNSSNASRCEWFQSSTRLKIISSPPFLRPVQHDETRCICEHPSLKCSRMPRRESEKLEFSRPARQRAPVER
jgi:hypothetical protein